ncbi:glycerate kinase [Quadrisphaera sp. DSM 44207]|uniref:glycerate kinase family protein n=1 Tax=Quadrisphaera sp. DSM 44207 TaxID=1881057 RepID=UPI000891FDC5|nr:glycerate kinase [Quadrisphaera sp. DSM 44207]SDQ32975.1 glycerate kinase [Quadrisphaera sp. DSM 44207]
MRVLVAPDGFTGTLTASQAARAMARGWSAARPGDEVELCPLSDGGPGFVEVLASVLGGRLLHVGASGPLGDPVRAPVLLVDAGGQRTAYVESALACGSALVPADRRDALAASTTGVGELLAAALEAGARRVVVGLGGSGTTDGGAGVLAALGAGDPDRLGRGGGALAGVEAGDLAGLRDVRARWADVDLVAASDVDVPLLGPRGAARGFGPQKGAGPAQVEALEAALADLVRAAEGALGPAARALAERPGSGAAGGLGYALALLGGRREGGARAVAGAVRLPERARGAGALLTGEGSLDWQSLHGKVVAEVARCGGEAGVPVVAVAGQVRLEPEQARAAGLAAAAAVAERPEDVPAALADPAGTLAARVRRLAAGWGA